MDGCGSSINSDRYGQITIKLLCGITGACLICDRLMH